MRRSAVLRGVLDRRPLFALAASASAAAAAACGAPAAALAATAAFRAAPRPLPRARVGPRAESRGGAEPRGGDRGVALLRRGRVGSRPTARQDAGEEEESAAADTTTATAGDTERAMRAFSRWSMRTGGCSADELVQGVQQSYYGLGVLLNTLSESARPHLLNSNAVSLSNCVEQLKTLLSKQYGLSPEQMTVATNNKNDKNLASAKQEESAAMKEIVQALQTVIPISKSFAEELFHLWYGQCARKANVFCVAAPTDFIISTKVVCFHECRNIQEVYSADDSPLKVTNVFPSSAGVHDTSKAEESSSDNTNNADRHETTNASNGAKTDNENVKKNMQGQTLLTYKDKKFSVIPASAIACVVAMVDVIIPPQRYLSSFEWFYQRVTGHQSEYERIAAARIFATTNARSFVAPLDFIMRMFTGRQVEFMCNNGMSEMIGIPKNIEDNPPATRKLMCLYMDEDRKWVLSDILPVDNVFARDVPKSAKV